ncbi:hypothetical protein CS0771_51740 [Catellatospora sp. IY07-71]|nr:hypothetical protein CS0771_51740 [Catellatospora sp. IY07-71]
MRLLIAVAQAVGFRGLLPDGRSHPRAASRNVRVQHASSGRRVVALGWFVPWGVVTDLCLRRGVRVAIIAG